MSRPAHVVYTVSGIIGALPFGTEQYSFSVRKPLVDDVSVADMMSTADDLRTAWSTNLRPLYGDNTKGTEFRVAAVGDDGHVKQTEDGEYIQGINTTEGDGTGSNGVIYPLQAAVCVSLMTHRAGPTGKGRFYLPMLGVTLDSSHGLETEDAETIRDACKGYINAINDFSSHKVSVISSKGYSSEVTGVRVGRRIDSLRSRARSVDERYVSTDL